jgi:hypothetical protein
MNMPKAHAFKGKEVKKYGLETYIYPPCKICKNVGPVKKKLGVL